jgi:hypothetical protein
MASSSNWADPKRLENRRAADVINIVPDPIFGFELVTLPVS